MRICRLRCFGKVLCSWDLLKAHLIYCSSTTSIEPRLVSSLHHQSPLSLSLIPLSLSLGIKSSQVGYGGHDRTLSWHGCPWLLYSQLGSTTSAWSGNFIVTYMNALSATFASIDDVKNLWILSSTLLTYSIVKLWHKWLAHGDIPYLWLALSVKVFIIGRTWAGNHYWTWPLHSCQADYSW